jgi:hypothetical protein
MGHYIVPLNNIERFHWRIEHHNYSCLQYSMCPRQGWGHYIALSTSATLEREEYHASPTFKK